MNSCSKNEKNKSKQQQQPVCIFCQKRPLTKEHLWPDWLKSIIGKDDTTHHDRHLFNADFISDNLIVIEPNLIRKNGNSLNRTLKIVCEECNNTWMSKIEDKAKTILEALILNKPIKLDRKQQKMIVQWAVLRTIISEFTDEKTRVVTAKERKEFYQTNEVPANWYVWIGKKETEVQTQPTYHHVNIQVAYRQIDGTYLMPNRDNTQSSYFGIGEFIIYTFSWPEDTVLYKFTSAWANKMIILHPREYYQINWSDVPCMEKDEVQGLRRYMFTLKNQLRFLSRR